MPWALLGLLLLEEARGQEGNESPVSPGIRVSFSQV